MKRDWCSYRFFLAVVGITVAISTPCMAAQKAPANEGASPATQAEAIQAGAAQTVPGPDYVIGPGDIIDISVWKDEALTRQVSVLPDGWISFPLLGPIKAGGKTLAQVKEELEGKIAAYMPDPVLSVEVKQVNSMLIYVIGRVNQPNRFIVNTNVNVLQGLAMAGGLNPFAKRDKVKIFRHEGEKTRIFPFHYDDVVEGKKLEENIMLKRGDVIVVP